MNISKSYFNRYYWNYYLELKDQIIATKRYIEFDELNMSTFSSEYLKLLQATCSEIDVLAKIIAQYYDSSLNPDKLKSIQKWGYFVGKCIPNISSATVRCNDQFPVQPWENWENEIFQTENNQTRY